MLASNYTENTQIYQDIDLLRQALLDDLYLFFYYGFARVRNIMPETPDPVGRKNHFRIMADSIMAALRGEKLVVPISLPPRYGKTEMICYAIAWCYAHNPMANNIYGSYKKTLAAEKTETVRQIMQSAFFQSLFDARLSKSSSAKDNFLTIQGGRTIAVGADGSGLGSGAGMAGDVPYGGAIWLDDMMKAQDSASQTLKDKIAKLHSQTLVNRRNSPATTPIFVIAQRIGEDDLTGMLLKGKQGEMEGHLDTQEFKPLDNFQQQWNDNAVIIPALDAAKNALWPAKHNTKYLLELKKNDPYTFYAQMQQDPISSMSKVFQVDKIAQLVETPEMLATFAVIDSAETAEEVNDASAFHLLGVYEPKFNGVPIGRLAVHSIFCHKCRVETQDLLAEFELFWQASMRCTVKPRRVYIEKKSSGTMLIGQLRERQGIILIPIERSGSGRGSSNSKQERFKQAAPYVAMGLFSIDSDAPHKDMVLSEMKSVNHKGTQKHDDIVDTVADAIRLALIDKVIYEDDELEENDGGLSKEAMGILKHNQRINRRMVL